MKLVVVGAAEADSSEQTTQDTSARGRSPCEAHAVARDPTVGIKEDDGQRQEEEQIKGGQAHIEDTRGTVRSV